MIGSRTRRQENKNFVLKLTQRKEIIDYKETMISYIDADELRDRVNEAIEDVEDTPAVVSLERHRKNVRIETLREVLMMIDESERE